MEWAAGHVTLADPVSLMSFIWSILLIFAVYAGVEKRAPLYQVDCQSQQPLCNALELKKRPAVANLLKFGL